jgi:arylsulfatase A-like enzyme
LGKAAALLDGAWKLIEREKGKTELFHITADPLEQQDLADAEPQRLAALRARLAELRRGDVTELPPDLRSHAP